MSLLCLYDDDLTACVWRGRNEFYWIGLLDPWCVEGKGLVSARVLWCDEGKGWEGELMSNEKKMMRWGRRHSASPHAFVVRQNKEWKYNKNRGK